MKVAHFGEFAPHRCGLYHTMKDLIKAERGEGIDAHFIDCIAENKIGKCHPGGKKDGWLTTSDVKVAKDADLLVRHTIIPNELENCGIPLMLAIHGRPESSLLMDEHKVVPVIEAFFNKGQDERYKAFFTFWKEHMPFWRYIIPENKLHYVPAMVDLMEWRPGKVKPFDLGKHAGSPNILICDIWRDDVTPFPEVMAVAKFIKENCPEGRLHIAAAPTGNGAQIFWRALRKTGVLGYAVGQTKDIKELYEAADVIVTPHKMATRIVREGLATGTSVINKDSLGNWWENFQRFGAKQLSVNARQSAEKRFNIKQAGVAVVEIFKKVLERKSQRRKVLIDLGGHLGETVRRFYKEVVDARFYDIFTFEPHKECFKKLQSVLSRLPNVTFRNKAVVKTSDGQKHEMRQLYPGKVNDGDGSTLVKGKTTGGVNYANGSMVRCIDLKQMLGTNGINGDDYVILKMNIEGGEYGLMEYIIDENMMGCFNQIYVQTHKDKLDMSVRAYRANTEKRFTEACEKQGVQLFMQDKGMAKFQCEEVPG